MFYTCVLVLWFSNQVISVGIIYCQWIVLCNHYIQKVVNGCIINAFFFWGSPSLPLNVTIFPISNGAQISWIQNFNGGFNQTFFIDYHLKDDNIWMTIQLQNSTNSRKISWTIGNLHPGCLYVFRMFSRNKIGDSNKTEEIVVKIPGNLLTCRAYQINKKLTI